MKQSEVIEIYIANSLQKHKTKLRKLKEGINNENFFIKILFSIFNIYNLIKIIHY
jgi:hypothetical protein